MIWQFLLSVLLSGLFLAHMAAFVDRRAALCGVLLLVPALAMEWLNEAIGPFWVAQESIFLIFVGCPVEKLVVYAVGGSWACMALGRRQGKPVWGCHPRWAGVLAAAALMATVEWILNAGQSFRWVRPWTVFASLTYYAVGADVMFRTYLRFARAAAPAHLGTVKPRSLRPSRHRVALVLAVVSGLVLGSVPADAPAMTGAGTVAKPGSKPPQPESGAPKDFEGNWVSIVHQCLDCHKRQHPVEMERYLWGTHYKERINCLKCHGSTDHNQYVTLGYRFSLKTTGADGTTEIGSGEQRQYAEWWPVMVVRAYQACQNCHAPQFWEWIGLDRRPAKLENAATPFHGFLRYDHGISAWWDTQMSSFGLAERENWGDEIFGEGCVMCHSQTMEWNLAGTDPEHLRPIGEVFPDLVKQQRASLGTRPVSYTGNDSLFLARCVECHARHTFSKEEALSPEACAKCHMGPDHPQYEAYDTSKHGWAYRLYGAYPAGRAPTCATCHMSEKAGDGHTIHVTNRGIAWNYKKGTPEFSQARDTMLSRCGLCHSKTRIAAVLEQVDVAAVEVPGRFRAQAGAVLKDLYDEGLVTPPFNPFFGKPVEMLPTFFHAMPWRTGRNKVSEAEGLFWNTWREFGSLSMETGAFHFNPAYLHWQGLKPADEFLGDLIDRAEALRAAQKGRRIHRVD